MNDYEKVTGWIKRRFIFLVLVGIVLWFGYGIWNSSNNMSRYLDQVDVRNEQFNERIREQNAEWNKK